MARTSSSAPVPCGYMRIRPTSCATSTRSAAGPSRSEIPSRDSHMRKLPPCLLLACLAFAGTAGADGATGPGGNHPVAIVIHGGAGTIRRSDMTPAQDAAYRQALTRALQAGYEVLKNGGRAIDAVQAAIVIMEDSPLFNAGRGAVFTRGGLNELDAALMDGETLEAGTVGAVQHI